MAAMGPDQQCEPAPEKRPDGWISKAKLEEMYAIDKRAVYVGSVVTVIATFLFFVMPDLLSPRVGSFRAWYFETTGNVIVGENPFTPLRLVGGCVGGAVAGWMCSEQGSGLALGMKAATYGLVLATLVAIIAFLSYWSFIEGMFPPPVVAVTTMIGIYTMMLFGPHLIGGALFGWLFSRLS